MPAVCKTGAKVMRHPTRKGDFAHGKQKFLKGTRSPVKAGQPGGFDFPTQLLGTSKDGRCAVYFDPSLLAQGQANAQEVLANVDAILKWHDAVFGYTGGPTNVIVAAVNGATDGSGGAYHYGCDFSSGADLYCSAAFGITGVVPGLFSAELSECYMGPNPSLGQKAPNPWGCGFSNGEGLSRVCANETCALVGSPGALDALGYGAASSWNPADNWVDQTEQTDQDYDSTGCSMVAIDYLRSKGYALYQVAQAPCDTLEMCFNSLTGGSGFYNTLVAAVNALPSGVTTDYPFTGGPNPGGAVPGGGPNPPPPPPPGGGALLDTSATLTVGGVSQPVEVVILPAGSIKKTIDVWAVLQDSLALATAIMSGNATAIIAAATQLLADLGIAISAQQRKELTDRLTEGNAWFEKTVKASLPRKT